MRKVAKWVATAALVAGTGLGGLALATPAAANGGGGGGSLISIGNVDVLTAELLSGNTAACTSQTNNHQQGWVKKH